MLTNKQPTKIPYVINRSHADPASRISVMLEADEILGELTIIKMDIHVSTNTWNISKPAMMARVEFLLRKLTRYAPYGTEPYLIQEIRRPIVNGYRSNSHKPGYVEDISTVPVPGTHIRSIQRDPRWYRPDAKVNNAI